MRGVWHGRRGLYSVAADRWSRYMNNLSIFLASCQGTHGREKGAPDDAPVLDILMVTYRSEAFERAAIDSIRAKTDVPYRLTVIDNNADNRSLTQIWNAFARQSRAPYLCFVNPDIICGAGWASALLRALDMPSVAVASPSMPYRGGGAGDPCSRLQALDAPEVFDAAGSLIEAQMDALAGQLPSIVLDDPYGYGYCYGVRRDWMVLGFIPWSVSSSAESWECVVVAGWMTSDLTSATLASKEKISRPSMNLCASS